MVAAPAAFRAQATGTFAPQATSKRLASTLNMHDTAASHFYPEGRGPFEELAGAGADLGATTEVPPEGEGQVEWGTREIKLKCGRPLPDTSYRDHYPPKELPLQAEVPADIPGGPCQAPFLSRTTYQDEFHPKPFRGRPVEPLQQKHQPAPWLLSETTYQEHYKPSTLPGGGGPRGTRAAVEPLSQMPSMFETTHRAQFTPKEAPGRQPVGQAGPHAPLPWLASDTTKQDHFVPKELPQQSPAVQNAGSGGTLPFSGTTTYKADYVPKEGFPVMPPLTGFSFKDGLYLPGPRKNLGVQFWHRGVPDKFFCLIPATLGVPCSATQLFTTLHDDQEQACIHIYYGNSPVATDNLLLGRFFLLNIPPAPKDVPKIEVTFHLDRDSCLTVSALDLDTNRMKEWVQRGEIIALERC